VDAAVVTSSVWLVTVRVTPPNKLPQHHPWQVDEVRQLRIAGAPLAVVARWATQAVRCSALALSKQVGERRN